MTPSEPTKTMFGLKRRDLENLTEALRRFPEIEQALLFGSRAKGIASPGSDVDVALKGPRITDQTILRLRAALDELPLPFFFDIMHYETIRSRELIDHIDRVGCVIYPAEE